MYRLRLRESCFFFSFWGWVCFGGITSRTQRLLLGLCAVVIPVTAVGDFQGCQGSNPVARVPDKSLPTVLSVQSHLVFFKDNAASYHSYIFNSFGFGLHPDSQILILEMIRGLYAVPGFAPATALILVLSVQYQESLFPHISLLSIRQKIIYITFAPIFL